MPQTKKPGRLHHDNNSSKAPHKKPSKQAPKKAQPERLQSKPENSSSSLASLPVKVQQSVVDVFSASLSIDYVSIPDVKSEIQKIKQHLYNRDFHGAFGTSEARQAYAARWSPSRAVGYADLFCGVEEIVEVLRGGVDVNERWVEGAGDRGQTLVEREDLQEGEEVNGGDAKRCAKITCLGAGAGAEVVALVVASRHLARDSEGTSESREEGTMPHLAISAVDIADWSDVLEKLRSGLCRPDFSLSAPSTTTTAPPSSTLAFHQSDALTLPPENLAPLLVDTALVTLLFTLNELYSTSIARTTAFLLSLTYLTAPGTLLLVVDSPGSYSTVCVGANSRAEGRAPGEAGDRGAGTSEKRYPMAWLLDHTLLEVSSIGSSKLASGEGEKQWVKIRSEESRWFRLKGLKYGLELEDMRYQVHLYRRL